MTLFLVYCVISYYLIQRLMPHSIFNEKNIMSMPERLFVSVLWLPLLLLALFYSLLVHFYHLIIHDNDY